MRAVGPCRPLPSACTATLSPTGARQAEGVLRGHPAEPLMRTLRAGDMLHVEIRVGERVIGSGTMQADPVGDPPLWVGEIEIDRCTWWATARRGTGVVTLSVPFREDG